MQKQPDFNHPSIQEAAALANSEKGQQLLSVLNNNHGKEMEQAFALAASGDYVQLKKRHEQGIDLPDGYVPDTAYVLVDKDHYVGLFNLRHYLNDALKEGAGHIGYGICKSYRGQGYATAGLALVIEEAKKIIPEDEIYISVHKNNPASLTVQKKNGAIIHHEDEFNYYTRIKI